MMMGGKLLAAVGGAFVAVAVVMVSGFVAWTGSLAMDLTENGPVPSADLEAAYREIGGSMGVDWVALAAWDGAENGFLLPLPTEDELYREQVASALDRRRVANEAFCLANPDAKWNCPPGESTLAEEEHWLLWRGTVLLWEGRRKHYIRAHAERLAPHMLAFYLDPGAVYRLFLTPEQAGRAADLYEAMHLLEALEEEEDWSEITPTALPLGWTRVDGFTWPVRAPLSSRFGWRISPFDSQRQVHTGIDLAIPVGTPIGAAKAGTVIFAQMDATYGLMVVLDHGDGYRSLYAHNSALQVTVDQRVGSDQVIANAGSTGKSTGPHLHLEIHYRTPIDPLLLLPRR